jgi:hypothetical protein
MKLSPILLFPTGAIADQTTMQTLLRTPQTADRICATIRESGLPDRHAAALARVNSASLERWRQEDGEFAGRLVAAREEFRNARLREIRQARNRDGSLNREAQAWLRKNGFQE